jgi:hypothetical protein
MKNKTVVVGPRGLQEPPYLVGVLELMFEFTGEVMG